MAEKLYWEVRDVARAAGRSKTTVQKLIALGLVKPDARTIRGCKLFDPKNVEKALDTIQRQSTARGHNGWVSEKDVARNSIGEVVFVTADGFHAACGLLPPDCVCAG